MQTDFEAVERQVTLAVRLSLNLHETLRSAVQGSRKPTEKELFQVMQDAYRQSEEVCSTLEGIPAMSGPPVRRAPHPAEDPNAIYSDEEGYDVGNVAFIYDPSDPDGALPDGLQLESHLRHAAKEVAPDTTASGRIPAGARGPTVAKTPALARDHGQEESDDDSRPEGHSTYDIPALTSSDTNTIHKFLTSCFENKRIPSDLSISRPKTRPVRDVERAIREKDRVTEMVYAPSMGDVFHQFVEDEGIDDLTEELTDELRGILTSGPRLANLCQHFHSEGDVEYAFRVSHLTIVAEIINYIEKREEDDRLYPYRGIIVSKNDNIPGYRHAFADLELANCPCEIRKPTSIGPRYTSTLLDIEPHDLRLLEERMKDDKVFGATYNFSWPAEKNAKLNKETQPLVQIYTQLIEKGSYFGIASSHDFSYFVVRDPQYPRRLYMSRLYSTYPSIKPAENTATNNALYTLYKFLRVACGKPDLHERFFLFFREETQSIAPAAAGSPVFAKNGCVDVGPTSNTALAALDAETQSKPDASGGDDPASPVIAGNARATELPRQGKEKVTGFYKDFSTSIGSDESLQLTDPAPPKASSRPSGQTKATAKPAPAAQPAPAGRTRNAPAAQAAPTVPPQGAAAQPSRPAPSTRGAVASESDHPAAAATGKRANTKGKR